MTAQPASATMVPRLIPPGEPGGRLKKNSLFRGQEQRGSDLFSRSVLWMARQGDLSILTTFGIIIAAALNTFIRQQHV